MLTIDRTKGDTRFYSGEVLITIITADTELHATEKLTSLILQHDIEFEQIAEQIRNIPPEPKSCRPTPFREKERLLDRLCREAGVKDS